MGSNLTLRQVQRLAAQGSIIVKGDPSELLSFLNESNIAVTTKAQRNGLKVSLPV